MVNMAKKKTYNQIQLTTPKRKVFTPPNTTTAKTTHLRDHSNVHNVKQQEDKLELHVKNEQLNEVFIWVGRKPN